MSELFVGAPQTDVYVDEQFVHIEQMLESGDRLTASIPRYMWPLVCASIERQLKEACA